MGVRRLSTAAVAMCAAAALLLSGCSGGGAKTESQSSSGGQPVKGGNLTVQISQDPSTLDPSTSTNATTQNLAYYLYEGLFALDGESKATPMVAKGYTLSKDKKTYTFTIRDGLKFSDGSTLTSKDVVASLRYWMDRNSYGEPIGKILDSLTAPDAQTVVLALTKPWPVPLVMADSFGAVIFKASVLKNVKEGAEGFGEKGVIGSGPYRLKSWKRGQEIVLERNPYYTSRTDKPSGYAGAKHAYLDTITLKVVSDANAAMNGLKTGLWDVFSTPTTDQYNQLKATKGVVVSPFQAGGSGNVVFIDHAKESFFHSAKARDALNMAIDKKAIIAAIGVPDLITATGAWADKANTNLHSRVGKKEYEKHDPKRAKKLFAEAGYHGQKLRILTTDEFPSFPTMATLIQDQLRKIGVKSKVEIYDFATMISKAKKKEWDMMPLIESARRVLPQLSIDVTGLLPYLGVTGGYDSAQMNGYIDAYSSATTDAERRKIGKKIQALVWKDKPVIVISQSREYIAYTAKLHGYNHYMMNFWNAWLEK